jgi:hypothetical protein
MGVRRESPFVRERKNYLRSERDGRNDSITEAGRDTVRL